ncbi:DUF1311 domain-containing protein [Acinetobacter pittii]|uniref:lysozyme inhibitor LprI family protein n=1 Tax=Acinetobacter pittii TaxID=48296 RepID=UPI001EFD365D|nr:lysozyme inhibitor LprI family protein [Acinetobacter pittii]MCG9492318.1 DUF1311 domain-containing protein [Acinetobacter pittii]
MTMKKVISLGCLLLLIGCDQVKSITESSVKCDNETAKQLLVESFSKSISDLSSDQVKELINTENTHIDMGKLRSTLKQITFNVTDIRTNNSDPNSRKEYCSTKFIVKIPDNIIKDADASRALYEQSGVAQAAILNDLDFEQNQLKAELEYIVQPTDDHKKVYVTLENADSLAYFVRDIAIDSLLKNPRQTAIHLAEQKQEMQAAEQAAIQQEYDELRLTEAQNNLSKANENLNLVWNATTAEVRQHLLDEQRVWLKKRKLECKLQGHNEEENLSELTRLNCEINMTTQRTSELRQKIYYLE